MTAARVENVYADTVRAREFLSQAEQFVADAALDDIHSESAAVLLHNSTVAACDAVLQHVGLRVTSGDGAHVLRIRTALEYLGEDDDLLERLDATRERRNEASYHAILVPAASVAEAREAAEELLDRVRALLG